MAARVVVALLALLAGSVAPQPISVWHLTDIHVDPYYMVGSRSAACNCETHDACPRLSASCVITTNASQHPALPFGMPEQECATPPSVWEAALTYLNDRGPATSNSSSSSPQLVFFTGDFGEAGLADSCSADSPAKLQITNAIHHAYAGVRAALPTASIYGVLGNHDSAPGDEFGSTASMAWLYGNVSSAFCADAGSNSSVAACVQSFRTGGWYAAAAPLPNLTVIALNTNYWSVVNPIVGTVPQMAEAQFVFLNASLARVASTPGMRAVILGHIPPQLGDWVASYYSRYRALLSSYPPRMVAASFFGHSHVDQATIVRHCAAAAPNGSLPIVWQNTSHVNWCSGGNLVVGDVFDAGLEDGDAWCPYTSVAGAAGVAACEAVCGPLSDCAGFTWYPSAGAHGACCFRTSVADMPANATSTAVCYRKTGGGCGDDGGRDAMATPLHVMFIGPSLTEGYPPSNPALREYIVDVADGFRVIDSITHSGNLTAANANWAFLFDAHFSAATAYGVPDLSAASWETALGRMALPGSREWTSYHRAWRKQYDGPSMPVCVAGVCKDDLIAWMNGTDADV